MTGPEDNPQDESYWDDHPDNPENRTMSDLTSTPAPWPAHTAADRAEPDTSRLCPVIDMADPLRPGLRKRDLHFARRSERGTLRTLCGRPIWAIIGPLDTVERETCSGCLRVLVEEDLR